jgi:hypothetical protein
MTGLEMQDAMISAFRTPLWTRAKKLALFADTGSRIVLHRLTRKARTDRMVHELFWGDWRANGQEFDGLRPAYTLSVGSGEHLGQSTVSWRKIK